MGARLHRRHHRQAARREGQPAGRRGHGRGRLEPGAARPAGHARAVRAAEPRRDHGAVPRQEEAAGLVRHGRVGRDGLLQHGRGAEEGHPQARDLEGPDQAGLQGPDRDAEPGVVGHRLSSTSPPGSRCWATTTARAAAGSTWTRCTRTSRSTRTRAPSPATWPATGEYVDGHLVRVPRQHATRPRARRSTSCSRRKASAGTSRPSRSTRARRSSRPRRSSPTGRRARTR